VEHLSALSDRLLGTPEQIRETQAKIRDNISAATGAVFDSVGKIVSAAKVNIFDNNYRPLYTATTSVISTVTNPLVSGSARETREKQMAEFTGWDNDPEVRNLQMKSWQLYVDTGTWQSPAQQSLYDEAERIRKANNPMYGGIKNGPKDAAEADKITPRSTTPGADALEGVLDNSNWGNIVKMGVGVFFLVFVVSMFRK
jgi:hypothetical protein